MPRHATIDIPKQGSEKERSLPGAVSLFRGKVRAPVSLTLTPEHHEKVRRATQRMNITRADLIALLIDRYADEVKI